MQSKAPNSVDVHVGSQIRFRRRSLKITQTTLATGLGITFQQVQKYEKGANRVGASRLQAIADILGVEVAFFFNNVTDDSLPMPHAEKTESIMLRTFLSSMEGFALNQAFFNIKSPLTRQRIVSLVKSLADRPRDEEAKID
ncbi:helix-turn-helix domain-containing protein [Rhizobium sp. XQZ8]|uniref:helix-turn-helix domain-containing protein n=1 Tax=Rhizobium populisoli TaxID=2859785 RepID=UPI001C66AC00|nr:helix-turn-helix transcriptional regulator [Rhizobium populisoli]MBW6425005.1 helix-turn-helix domain-containing protein [Rhizobium populisoli]